MSRPIAETSQYSVRFATDTEEVRAAQRLRFAVFNLELGEGLPGSVATGLDADEFDAVCDHLIVMEQATGTVVGTYRLQTGTVAAGSGLGFYSAREFDFRPLESARGELVELGRACVARAHRNQSVLGLLWRGIARYAEQHQARYLVGCSSLTSQNPVEGLAAYAQLARKNLVKPMWRTQPLDGWRCAASPAAVEAYAESGGVRIPRLMLAYLAAGAAICGEPALDPVFKTIDFLTWMDLQTMPARVLRKFAG
jgi:putative hemolysin